MYGGEGDAFRILMGKPEGLRPLGRLTCRWETNIKIRLKEMGWGVGWIDLTQFGDEWASGTVLRGII